MRRLAGLAALTLSVGVASPSAARAGDEVPPPPANLRANGGVDTWSAQRDYRIGWDVPAGLSPPVVAAHYRVRDPGGVVVDQGHVDWVETFDDTLPNVPGIYTVEVWLENSASKEGPPSPVKVRFDNVRPAEVEPIQIPQWLGRASFPYAVRLSYPPNMIPTSGIIGYAVTVDSSADSNPCTSKDRCTSTETNLGAGLGGSMFPIAGLPEGTSYLHAVAVSGSTMKSALARHAVLRVDLTDPVTRLEGNPSGWTNKPVILTATASDGGSGMEVGDPSTSPFTALQIDGGPPKAELGPSTRAAVITDGVHSIAYYARDAAGNVNDGGTRGGQENAPPQTATVRIDRGPPSVAFAAFQNPRDPELIRVYVRDTLSGPQPQKSWIGVRPAGSNDNFEALVTEPTASGFEARWDTARYPLGQFEFRAVGYDIAGNEGATMLRADGSKMVLSNPLKDLSALLAGFGGHQLVWHRCVKDNGSRHCQRESITQFEQRPAGRVVPFGRGIAFSGRLSAGSGAPLQGMDVQIVEHFGDGANPPERVTAAQTGSDGVFMTRLAPGPSREITASFRGTPTLTGSFARPVQLRVRTGITLGVSSTSARVGGRPLIFKGKVTAKDAGMPVGGKAVQLQFRLPGLPWTEFRTIQTDRQGRFRYPYRFTDDDSRGVRFQFRAYAPAQGNWPYEPGGSEPVAVWGR